MVNKTGSLPQPQHHQQQQQYYSGIAGGGLRKAGSYRDVDQIERETVSAMRVSGRNLISALFNFTFCFVLLILFDYNF